MATINVYVPDALKAEMDQHDGENWSQVAQEAFRFRLLTKRASTMEIEAVVERIKATAGDKSPRYQAGFDDGRKWAAEDADADDVEAWLDTDLDVEAETAEDMALSLAGALGYGVGGRNQVDWEALFGPNMPTSKAYVRGFVAGLDEVFREVAKRM